MTALPRTPDPVGPRPRTPFVLVVVAVVLGVTTLAAVGAGISALTAAVVVAPRALDAVTLAVGASALIIVTVGLARRASNARRRSLELVEAD